MPKLLFILLVVFSANLKAQRNATRELSLYFDQPEVLKKEGVKGIKCLFKDSRNLMWIGTDNGLFRYDGTNIIYRRHKAGDTTSIPNNTIASIAEDEQGNLWIGTMGGVACMNPYSFKCKVYTDELHNLPHGNFDNKILTGPSGEIWIGNSNGLYRLDKKHNIFKKAWQNVSKEKPLSGYVTSLLYWKPDTLIAGTFNDIVLINTKNFNFKRIAPLGKDILAGSMAIDRQHRLWIGTWGNGCIIGSSNLEKFQQYKWERDQPSGVSNIATSFAEFISANEHEMWVAGGTTLSRLPLENTNGSPDLSKAKIYKVNADKTNNDPGNIAILLADKNYIWTGGSSAVAKFSGGKSLFAVTPVQTKGAVENIQQINLSGKNYLAVSCWHGTSGIVFWNRENGSFKIINSVSEQDPFGSNISGAAVDKYNRIWLTSLAGTYLLDDQFHIATDLSKNKIKTNIPSAKKVNDILINKDTVWLACYKNGIDLYDLQLRKLKHFINNDGSGLEDNLIERIFKSRNGQVWLCGNGYFYKYLSAPSKFKKYDFSIEHSTYGPADITELPDGHLVIATETAGLIYFDPSSEKFERIATSLLQKEEAIVSVTSDYHGNIWYLTANHLVQYQPAAKKFTLFGEDDGLHIDGLQLLRCFNGKEIFLAESGRLLQFDPAGWQRKEDPARVLLQAVQVNDSSVVTSVPLHELQLNYNQNKIYFEFDGVTYTKPEQNQYAYKLDGVDKDWILSNKNSVSYANLSPGHYTFHIKAATYSGEWSKEYPVRIFISPPYWKTWWFLGLSALGIGALFVLVIRYIAQRNLRERILKLEKEQAVEKERNRIARDMHDDLGSGLTKIAILSEVAKTQLRKEDAASAQLENISYSSRELVDNLQNIIWVLNPQNDSLENLSAYIREYALKFFESTNVAVQFNDSVELSHVKLSEEQRRNLFMVVKETLNNIAKHAFCNAIAIDLSLRENKLQVEITDDGKGFELSTVRKFSNGLINMKQRMEQIGGSYEIISSAKGTKTKLIVPL